MATLIGKLIEMLNKLRTKLANEDISNDKKEVDSKQMQKEEEKGANTLIFNNHLDEVPAKIEKAKLILNEYYKRYRKNDILGNTINRK